MSSEDSYPQESITSERLVLRKMRAEDAPDAFEFLSIPEVRRFTPHPPMKAVEEAVDFINGRREGPSTYNFAVTLQGKVIGFLGSKCYPAIGYVFHPGFYRKRYAIEALRAFIPEMWKRMPSASDQASIPGYDYIHAYVDTENSGSVALLEKAGFHRGVIAVNEYSSAQLGERNAFHFYLPRPGFKLEDIAGLYMQYDEPFEPDLQ